MFQSRSTASGMRARQTSSACSPSSASWFSNSSPSRIRRATLRMTLESSTTRQVFITPSLFYRAPPRTVIVFRRSDSRTSCRLRMNAEVEDPVHVEDNQKASVESVYASRHTREPRVQIDRIVLAASRLELEHLADCI